MFADFDIPLEIATKGLIRGDAMRMECLQAACEVSLPDWMIVAGFIRNLIWDHLHQRLPRTPLNDVDLVFFDAGDLSIDRERHAQAQLSKWRPDIRWQVRNQARMHLRNGHAPYRSTLDAISFFPELETCIGVSLAGDRQIFVVAPYGIAHNWALTIQRNSRSQYPKEVMERRAADKRWPEIWPRLKMLV